MSLTFNPNSLEEKKKKKKKKKKSGGKKDACYHKVKSRYKVWPSAYASGALVKCRKVGAKNWGTKTTKEELELYEGKESLEAKIRDVLIKEGGAAGMKALKEQTKHTEKEIKDAIKGMKDVKQHEHGDYYLVEDETIDEESLHKWFKDGGWKQAGGKYDGKPCARQPGQKTTPKCVSRSKFKSMTKKQRDNAARRKRKKDPNQPKKTGAAKPTNVKTDPQKESLIKRLADELINEMIEQELSEVLSEKNMVEEYQMIEATYEDGSPVEENFGFYENLDSLEEAEYQGRKVKLNKIMRGDVKKFKVFVNSGKKDKDGKIVAKKVNFGHGGTSAKKKGEKTMKIRKSNPKARKSFRARHNCDNPGPKTKARYWSCRKW